MKIFCFFIYLLSFSVFPNDLPVSAYVAIDGASGRLAVDATGHASVIFESADGKRQKMDYLGDISGRSLKDFFTSIGIGDEADTFVRAVSYEQEYERVVRKEDRSIKLLKIRDDFVMELFKILRGHTNPKELNQKYNLVSNNCSSILCETIKEISGSEQSCRGIEARIPILLPNVLDEMGIIVETQYIASASDQRDHLLNTTTINCLGSKLKKGLLSQNSIVRMSHLISLSQQFKKGYCDDVEVAKDLINSLVDLEVKNYRSHFHKSQKQNMIFTQKLDGIKKQGTITNSKIVGNSIELSIKVKSFGAMRFKRDKSLYSTRKVLLELEDKEEFDASKSYIVYSVINNNGNAEVYILQDED